MNKRLTVLFVSILFLLAAAPAKAEGTASSGQVAWSPNGQWIAYPCLRQDPADIQSFSIWRACISSLSGEATYVSPTGLYMWDSGPGDIAWSPDSSHVAFMCMVKGVKKFCITTRTFSDIKVIGDDAPAVVTGSQ